MRVVSCEWCGLPDVTHHQLSTQWAFSTVWLFRAVHLLYSFPLLVCVSFSRFPSHYLSFYGLLFVFLTINLNQQQKLTMQWHFSAIWRWTCSISRTSPVIFFFLSRPCSLYLLLVMFPFLFWWYVRSFSLLLFYSFLFIVHLCTFIYLSFCI